MVNLLFRYRILVTSGSGPDANDAGHYLEIYWDDSLNVFKVFDFPDATSTTGVLRTVGVDLGAQHHDYLVDGGAAPADRGTRGDQTLSLYSFCSGHDLQMFLIVSTFPYAQKVSKPNHFSCQAIVCDLKLSDTYTVTEASDSVSTDGTITVTATSSNGTIKFSLNPDFDYATEGQSSGLLTDLSVGKHTVYAKDAAGCIDSLNFEIGVPKFYNVLYQTNYKDFIRNLDTRLEILQRGYEGDPIEVKHGEDPIVIRYNGQGDLNKFTAIIPSQATIQLISETNFYFRDLSSSQDDRKYLARYLKNRQRTLIALLSDLVDFTNDGTGVDWTLSDDHIVLTAGQSSKYLKGVLSKALKGHGYTFNYNFDVLFASSLTPLPALSTFTSAGTGAGWVTGSVPTIDGNTSPLNTTQVLSAAYSFLIGQTYTIFYNLDLAFPSGSPLFIGITLTNDPTGTDEIKYINAAGDGGDLTGFATGVIEGHHTGFVTITAAAARAYIGIFILDFANFFGTVHNFQFTLNSLALPSSSANVDVEISLRDRFLTLIDQTIINATANGNHSGSTVLGDNVEPKYVTIEAVNGDGKTVTVTVNDLTIDSESVDVGYEVLWSGFVISTNGQEAYVPAPYEISIVATDGLEDLKNYNFLDEFGNKFIDNMSLLSIVNTILKKTDLNINVRAAINKLEAAMSDSDLTEPFAETFVNPIIFYQDTDMNAVPIVTTNCFDVLTDILEPFGARIVQRENKWVLYCLEEAVHEFKYREFDIEGNFIEDDSIDDSVAIANPILELSAYRDQDQVQETIPAYGKYDFIYNLITNASLIKSYSFEKDDIVITDRILTFRNWNINIQHAPGAKYGIVQTKAFQGNYNFYFQPYSLSNFGVNADKLSVLSEAGLIEHDKTDSMEFSFDYSILLNNDVHTPNAPKTTGNADYTVSVDPSVTSYITGQSFFIIFESANVAASTININGIGVKQLVQSDGSLTPPGFIPNNLGANIKYDGIAFYIDSRLLAIAPVWVKLQWSLRVGDYYLNDSVWTNDIRYKYSNVYVEAFNDPQNFKVNVPFVGLPLTTDTFQVEFILCSAYTVDFVGNSTDLTPLKAITTKDKRVGYRIKGALTYTSGRTGVEQKIFYWILIDDDGSNSGIETVRPNDYNDGYNQKIWKLEDQIISRRANDRNSTLNDFPAPEATVSNVYLDNVVLRHLPNGVDPVSTITTEKEVNKFIKVNYSKEYLLNDIDTDNINNSERTYENFFIRADGSPTVEWTRRYRAGTDKILSLLVGDFLGQYQRPSNKLTGSLVTWEDINITSVLSEIFDGGRKYMFMGYELHDKECTIKFDLSEVKDVVTDPDGDEIDADFNLDFNLDFKS